MQYVEPLLPLSPELLFGEPPITGRPMAVALLCAPVVYPWYLLWLLPFLRSVSVLPLIIWTVSIIPTYYVWHLRTIGGPWLVPGWIMGLEYGAILAGGAIIALRRVMQPAIPSAPETTWG